jgi:hypothetical protein
MNKRKTLIEKEGKKESTWQNPEKRQKNSRIIMVVKQKKERKIVKFSTFKYLHIFRAIESLEI